MKLAAALILAATAAQGQACNTSSEVYSTLAERFGESRQSYGLTPGGLLMEVWANGDTGTFTVILTRADGVSCAIASGELFTNGPGAATPEGDPG
jgi:hypothetical protein